LFEVAPIHAREMNGSINRGFGCGAERLIEKSNERITRHLARSHRKLVMLRGPTSHDTANRHVVGRIEERHVSSLTNEQAAQIIGTSRVATQQPVFAQLPDISTLGDRRAMEAPVVNLVGGVG